MMDAEEFDKHLVAYHEDGNDYRYVFTREQAAEIKDALKKQEPQNARSDSL